MLPIRHRLQALLPAGVKRIMPRRLALFPDPSGYSTLTDPLEVPVQAAAYELVRDRYLQPGDRVLDVGFGLGYGFRILTNGNDISISGVEVDLSAVERAQQLFSNSPCVAQILQYDGIRIPFPDNSFDLVTAVDVLEHVPDYIGFAIELLRVARRSVFVSTPNRRPEYTNWDGTPKNHWHLREWSFNELRSIFGRLPVREVNWHFIDGPWEGPFVVSDQVSRNTMALSPMLMCADSAADPPAHETPVATR